MSAQKTALITGANQGIGFGTCCQLAKNGYNLVLACRNEINARNAVKVLQRENPSITVEYVLIDLASIESVQNCIRILINDGHQFDVIILNAGVYRPGQRRTIDDYETTFQVNYLSQYLLVQHLINHQSNPVKVITLNSIMYTLSNFTHIPKKAEKWINMFANTNNQIKAYVLSKFAMALLAQSFNKQGICATSVHPGIVQTNIFNNAISPTSRALLRNIMKKRLTSLQSAAEYVVSCVENDIPSNKYNCAGKIVDLNRAACCERNISNLDAMNKHIMEKYGLKSL